MEKIVLLNFEHCRKTLDIVPLAAMKSVLTFTLAVLALGSCWDGCSYSHWTLTGLLAAIRLASCCLGGWLM